MLHHYKNLKLANQILQMINSMITQRSDFGKGNKGLNSLFQTMNDASIEFINTLITKNLDHQIMQQL